MEFWIMANLVKAYIQIIYLGQTILVVKTLYILIAKFTILSYKKVFGLMILLMMILEEL